VLKGLLSEPKLVGPNHACDREWHDWRVEADGEINRLWVDGRQVGEAHTSHALLGALAGKVAQVGFGVLDTYVSVDYLRVGPCA
ncbi:MAG: hypothetical protein WCP21_02410, partial [Armatimonadota bacterium]